MYSWTRGWANITPQGKWMFTSCSVTSTRRCTQKVVPPLALYFIFLLYTRPNFFFFFPMMLSCLMGNSLRLTGWTRSQTCPAPERFFLFVRNTSKWFLSNSRYFRAELSSVSCPTPVVCGPQRWRRLVCLGLNKADVVVTAPPAAPADPPSQQMFSIPSERRRFLLTSRVFFF